MPLVICPFLTCLADNHTPHTIAVQLFLWSAHTTTILEILEAYTHWIGYKSGVRVCVCVCVHVCVFVRMCALSVDVHVHLCVDAHVRGGTLVSTIPLGRRKFIDSQPNWPYRILR